MTEEELNMSVMRYVAAVGHARLVDRYESKSGVFWNVEGLLDQADTLIPNNPYKAELNGARQQFARENVINPETVPVTNMVHEASKKLNFFGELTAEQDRESARDLLVKAISEN